MIIRGQAMSYCLKIGTAIGIRMKITTKALMPPYVRTDAITNSETSAR